MIWALPPGGNKLSGVLVSALITARFSCAKRPRPDGQAASSKAGSRHAVPRSFPDWSYFQK